MTSSNVPGFLGQSGCLLGVDYLNLCRAFKVKETRNFPSIVGTIMHAERGREPLLAIPR